MLGFGFGGFGVLGFGFGWFFCFGASRWELGRLSFGRFDVFGLILGDFVDFGVSGCILDAWVDIRQNSG